MRLVLQTAGRAAARPRRPSRRRASRRIPAAAAYAAFALIALAALALGRAGVEAGDPSAPTVPAPAVRVIDGDTLDVAGERVRIVNIDTPEMPPKAQCASEADGALRARDRLQALVAAGEVGLDRTGTDRYGRTLAYVSVDGADAGRTLVAEGLARPWEGRRRSWCA